MGAELAAIIGAASVAKGLVSAAVARGALASFVGVGAAVAAAKTAAAAARGVSHMVIDDAVDAVEAYAAGLSLRSLDAEAQHGVLTWAAETIERHFDSDAEEAYTDCVYSLANAHAGYSQLLRTVADAATRYASKLSFHRGQAHAALARLAGPIFRIDGVEVRPRDVIDKEAADAEDARIIDLINKELGDIESDLELAVEHCEELLSQQALIISTLLQARDRIVDTVRHLPQQFDLASHGGGGRNEYDRFRPGEIHPGSQIIPTEGDKDGASGAWLYTPCRKGGRDYQVQVGGTKVKGDSILEYHLDYTPAKPGDQPFVDYDGHTWRDDPTTGERQEVYLEAKDGYRDHIVNCSEAEADVYLKRFIRQAKRQLDAIEQSGSSARLEWHFSDPDVADSVREAFAAVGEQDAAVKNVLVYYTPKVRR